MEYFPLASQAHNNSELELLLYSWAKLNVKSYKYLRESEWERGVKEKFLVDDLGGQVVDDGGGQGLEMEQDATEHKRGKAKHCQGKINQKDWKHNLSKEYEWKGLPEKTPYTGKCKVIKIPTEKG